MAVRTTGVDYADSGGCPWEVIGRMRWFRVRFGKHAAVVGSQNERHGTVQYREVINVSCGNDTAVYDMTG